MATEQPSEPINDAIPSKEHCYQESLVSTKDQTGLQRESSQALDSSCDKPLKKEYEAFVASMTLEDSALCMRVLATGHFSMEQLLNICQLLPSASRGPILKQLLVQYGSSDTTSKDTTSPSVLAPTRASSHTLKRPLATPEPIDNHHQTQQQRAIYEQGSGQTIIIYPPSHPDRRREPDQHPATPVTPQSLSKASHDPAGASSGETRTAAWAQSKLPYAACLFLLTDQLREDFSWTDNGHTNSEILPTRGLTREALPTA